MKKIGFAGALHIGIGAIFGGSIFLISGPAYLASGPSMMAALLAAALIAWITAYSFAELAIRFPESGGVYVFAKKVLGVEAAFSVGWVILLARVLISVLYALGIGAFLGQLIPDVLGVHEKIIPVLTLVFVFSLGAAGLSGRTVLPNAVKTSALLLALAGGLFVLAKQDAAVWVLNFQPFFKGWTGFAEATGLFFISVQGFSLVAAMAGDMERPRPDIPRAMFYSLLAAVALYLVLLFLMAASGFALDSEAASTIGTRPETAVLTGIKSMLGMPGFYLVLISGIFSMYSALVINLRAGAELVAAMANDRTFPTVLGLRSIRGIPVRALGTVASGILLALLLLSDLEAAGASSSLIFLLSFAVAQTVAILLRIRRPEESGAYLTPFFPYLPVIGIAACMALAVYQGLRVPLAGVFVSTWLGAGVFLYWFQFSGRARVVDAGFEAANPELSRIRGKNPLYLVPVANPARTRAILSVARTMIPPSSGRLLLLSVARAPRDWEGINHRDAVHQAQEALTEAFVHAYSLGLAAEALITVAPDPWDEIERVARSYRCDGIILGMSDTVSDTFDRNVVRLVNAVPCDVMLLKAPDGWNLPEYAEVLVPTAGRSDHSELRARLFGSLARNPGNRLRFITVIPQETIPEREQELFEELHSIMLDEFPGGGLVEVIRSGSIAGTILDRAEHASLLVLGMPRSEDGRKIIGPLLQPIIDGAPVPVLLIASKYD